ncbi:MAG TPA: hypothetical protein VG325_09515 [Solirubrobacteraceae bacterium]|nr:hypothetical protein [Solirubrobacteraceae bacterium]
MSTLAALPVVNPYSGDLVGEAPVSGSAEVTAALDRARACPELPRHERARILFAVAGRLQDERGETGPVDHVGVRPVPQGHDARGGARL